MRIDKWLWAARFFKTRGDASRAVASGRLRLDGAVMTKPHRNIAAGHMLTFPKADDIRVIKIIGMPTRRGPSSEAITLYEDLDPPQLKTRSASRAAKVFEARDRGTGRPTKRERRKIDELKS